jgi:rubrerythrin
MSKSEEFLKQAFAGESQANRKYLAFAEKAGRDGFPQVARLFRAAAEAETVHALSHLKALKGVGDTKANLEAAIAGETHEFEHMYPEMIAAAKEEGHKQAEKSFVWANEVEKVHAALYKKLLAALGSPQEEYPYYVCPLCGFTAEKDPPETCPVCGAKAKVFAKVE